MCNSEGVSLLKIAQSNHSSETIMTENGQSLDKSSDDNESAVFINIMKKDVDYSFGEGGLLSSVYADDHLIQIASKKTRMKISCFIQLA